jgi:hypothetical protein
MDIDNGRSMKTCKQQSQNQISENESNHALQKKKKYASGCRHTEQK